MKLFFISLYLIILCFKSFPNISTPPLLEFKTNYGSFFAILFSDKAPHTCNNFLRYVEEGFYDNTIAHRLITGYLIQFGAFDINLNPMDTHAPILNESRFTPSNSIGTLSMAFPRNKHNEASSQFFINLNNNDQLDFSSSSFRGYTVFGKIIQGEDIISKFQFQNTIRKSILYKKKKIILKHFPSPSIIIYTVKLINNEKIMN